MSYDPTLAEREAEAALKLAQADLEMAKAYHSARLAHERAVELRNLEEEFGPTGLRHSVLVRALEEKGVARDIERCGARLFGKGRIKIDLASPVLPMTLDGRSFEDLVPAADPWNSVRVRLRALVQIATALRDGSAAVIIDRAEALSEDNVVGMFNLLAEKKVAALLLRVADQKPTRDVLAEMKAGRTWWAEDGKITPVEG